MMKLLLALLLIIAVTESRNVKRDAGHCHTNHGHGHSHDHHNNVVQELNDRTRNFREGCRPRPNNGCRCTVVDSGTQEEQSVLFDYDYQCKNRAAVVSEINDRTRDFREKCYPRADDGCRCKETNVEGLEETVLYDSDDECKREQVHMVQKRRVITREEARANYNKVVEELNKRFEGYLENCFPRPKGCLCVTGHDHNGREITDRRRNDKDCKKKPKK